MQLTAKQKAKLPKSLQKAIKERKSRKSKKRK